MGCATCGGGSRRTTMQPARMGASPRGRVAMDSDESLGLVEFTGHGSRTYLGPSGTTYRFGDDPEHKQRRVREQDLPKLLSRAEYTLKEPPTKSRKVRAEAPDEAAENEQPQQQQEGVDERQTRRRAPNRSRQEESRQDETETEPTMPAQTSEGERKDESSAEGTAD